MWGGMARQQSHRPCHSRRAPRLPPVTLVRSGAPPPGRPAAARHARCCGLCAAGGRGARRRRGCGRGAAVSAAQPPCPWLCGCPPPPPGPPLAAPRHCNGAGGRAVAEGRRQRGCARSRGLRGGAWWGWAEGVGGARRERAAVVPLAAAAPPRWWPRPAPIPRLCSFFHFWMDGGGIRVCQPPPPPVARSCAPRRAPLPRRRRAPPPRVAAPRRVVTWREAGQYRAAPLSTMVGELGACRLGEAVPARAWPLRAAGGHAPTWWM